MHTLRERPLTLMFLAATVCVDLVLLGVRFDDDWPIVAILFGQCFVLGGWLVLGGLHRLSRAGLVVVGGLALCFQASSSFFEPPHFTFQQALAQSIAGVTILSGVAATLTWGCSAILNWISRNRSPPVVAPRWQFPLAELFGWTIIVAVASALLKIANFSDAGTNPAEILSTSIFAFIAALLMALFVPEGRRVGASNVVVAAAAVIAMFALMPYFVPMFDRQIASLVAASYVYVILWIIVLHLDRQIARQQRRLIESPAAADA